MSLIYLKEGGPTFHNRMNGTGEHYAKWNKAGGERQIPYDLTYKWNMIKKTNKQAKYNQRHWNKEGTPTFHSSMDGTGEYYAKWNKAGGERQIPCNLTYKWNLMNKKIKWAKYNQRHGNKEQTDSDQREEGRGITGKEGEGPS